MEELRKKKADEERRKHEKENRVKKGERDESESSAWSSHARHHDQNAQLLMQMQWTPQHLHTKLSVRWLRPRTASPLLWTTILLVLQMR